MPSTAFIFAGPELGGVTTALAQKKNEAHDLRIALLECQDYLASLMGIMAELRDWMEQYGGVMPPDAVHRFTQILSQEYGPSLPSSPSGSTQG